MAAQPRWAARLATVERPAVDAPQVYYDRLKPLCGGGIDIWVTEYLHALQGEDAVLEWTRGTTLRPYMDALEPAERGAFEDAFAERLRAVYPMHEDGVTLLPFQRMFIVARR